MTRNAEPLPAPLRDGPFSVARARRAGISRGRLRARDLVAPFPARGRKRLRRARDLLRIGSRSSAETRFRLFLVRNGLPEPLINHDIRDAQGRGRA